MKNININRFLCDKMENPFFFTEVPRMEQKEFLANVTLFHSLRYIAAAVDNNSIELLIFYRFFLFGPSSSHRFIFRNFLRILSAKLFKFNCDSFQSCTLFVFHFSSFSLFSLATVCILSADFVSWFAIEQLSQQLQS